MCRCSKVRRSCSYYRAGVPWIFPTLPQAEREGVHGGGPHAGGLLRRAIRVPGEDLVARRWVHGLVRAPPRAEPPSRLSASLVPRRREGVIGVPAAQAAVT